MRYLCLALFLAHRCYEGIPKLLRFTPDLADKAIDWQVTTETGSDHYGLLFSIRSDTDQVDNPINQRKFNTKKADWPLFQKTLNEAIQNNITLQHISEINDPRKQDCKNLILEEDQELQSKLEEIGEAITQVIQLAADKAIPKVKLGPKPKPWWNQELTKLRRELTHCQRVYTQQLQQLPIQEAYLFKKDFLIARNTYARAIKDAKKRHWNSFLEQETPQSIYKAMAYTKDQKVEKIPPNMFYKRAATSNEADIQLAISSINAHQINSASTAAAIYNVPRTTLRNRRAGIPARRDCQPNSRKLTQREEEVIISYILHLGLRGFEPTYVDVRDMADKLMAARGASLVGIHWPRNFVKRTDSLRTCFNRAYDRQRALCENLALIQRWFKLVEETKTKLGICDEDTYNFDKAGFIIGKITTQLVITGSERRGRPKSI
ncbi:hypothetical protein PtrM4_056660 [Pyrenophora tritici-repentis]|uniref:HTH CENPB-type domain-containing protein n=1 Tax=Pyrenophora tritici-repentis TaxID=45151 RepID=A0A834VSK3_9PLEO|nr:hypothetical protein PtrM4_056660 [Pyrenophora tritici-repentis]